MARTARFPQADWHDLACTNDTNSTISASVRHDPSRTNGTNHTISAKRKTRSFLHEWHEQHDFRKRKHDPSRTNGTNSTISASGRHDLSCTNGTNSTISASGSTIFLVIRALKIVSSTCRYRIIRVIRAPKKSCHRLVDIVSFVPFVLQRIVPSTCRYRVIRASRNRVIDLSISCPSYHSCSKKIVSSTCRYRIIRVIRALKYRVIDWSISCHSCLKISCHRLVDIVAFVSFVQDGIETFVPTKP